MELSIERTVEFRDGVRSFNVAFRVSKLDQSDHSALVTYGAPLLGKLLEPTKDTFSIDALLRHYVTRKFPSAEEAEKFIVELKRCCAADLWRAQQSDSFAQPDYETFPVEPAPYPSEEERKGTGT